MIGTVHNKLDCFDRFWTGPGPDNGLEQTDPVTPSLWVSCKFKESS